MRLLYILLFTCCFLKLKAQGSGILINEFMASNNATAIPGHADNDDWIELRNTTSSAVDISGYYVTDDLGNPTKFRLPTAAGSVVIPANGYLVLICSDNPLLGARHITLGLSASGEAIGLIAADGSTLIDSFVFGPQRGDISMGRHPVNTSQWNYMKNPTPGLINSTEEIYDQLVPAPTFSHSGGVYSSSFDLSIISDVPQSVIYYTLDGSDPDPQNINGKTFLYRNTPSQPLTEEVMRSYIYTSAIPISDRSSANNKVSVKSSSPNDSYSNSYFPTTKVTKGTVVRAIAVIQGGLPEVSTNTYFVFSDPDKYSFPIISVSMDESKLFDYDNGFYTWGRNLGTSHWCTDGNYHLGLRQSGHFEYFVNSTQAVSEEVVYRIHGGCSRIQPRKTLRVLGDGKLDYPFFDSYPQRIHRNLILRNSGSNWDKNLFKDAANHDIMDKMKIGKQENTPSIVFINGEYWGIHDIRERIDQHYLSTLYGVSSDSVDLLSVSGDYEVEEGDIVAFNQLRTFVNNNSFTNAANFDSLSKLVDFESLIDYYIAEIYLSNYDWPFNNVRLWRKKANNPNTSTSHYHDGRWRWILFDTDETYDYDFNALSRVMDSNNPFDFIFLKAMTNSSFKDQFSTRFLDLLNTNFLISRTTGIIDDHKSRYDAEIEEHTRRWASPYSSTWNLVVNNMRSYFQYRPDQQRTHLRNRLGLGESRNLTVNVSNKSHGYVTVNTIDILPATPGVSEDPYPWTGVYHQNLPVKITAKGQKGYRFKHWLRGSTIQSTNPELTISVSASGTYSYTAVFEEYIFSGNPFPVAKVLEECGLRLDEWSGSATPGSHPESMAFVYFNSVNPASSDPDHMLANTLGGFTSGAFNHTNRSRINGLGSDGFSFINTGGPAVHPGYPAGKLGGLLLALNTVGQDSVYVSWTGGTVLPNFRDYAIRLQYRRGDLLDFEDLLDQNGQPIEYVRNPVAGHSQVFSDIKLPAELTNQPYVQLLWNYYYKGAVTSGARPELRIDDIKVYTKVSYSKSTNQTAVSSRYGAIDSRATVSSGETFYEASQYVLMEPGFNTIPGVVFKAEINECND